DLAAVRRYTRYVVEPQVKAGPGHVAGATANGVIASIRATLQYLYKTESPAGRHVAVQGLGAIGERVADWLWSSGAELTLAEVDAKKLRHWRNRPRVKITTPERIIGTSCDLLSPNALGGIISSQTKLNCRAVVGAANNPLTDDAAAVALHRCGILFAPDFLVNSGGLIEGAGRNLGFAGDTAAMIERIGKTLITIYRRAAREKKPPYVVALAMADARLKSGKLPSKFTMRMG
ncbi:MAG TPA: Glu/Leu/Phe/Val dehydrogenase family protein, partial [Acidobacteriota bacterium]|nr:Glu/Leu/Phe/Val dehydrogenase family protein [Acidobacteriota bacterium]